MHQLPLDPKKVEALADKARHYDIHPAFLPARVVGEHPIAPLFGELIAEARDYLSALSVEEIRTLIGNLPSGVVTIISGESISESGIARERIATYCVVAAVQSIYLSFDKVVREDLTQSEVLKVYPELAERFDRRDGLLQIGDDLVLHDGGVEYRDHILHYHQLLRRGYTSSPNFEFLGRLRRYCRETRSANSFGVAIDHRRIMPKEAYGRVIELDTWYGPAFDPAQLDDPQAVGLTVVVRNKNSLFGDTNQLERTEFLWSYRNGIKSFEMEEVSSIGYQFDTYYFNRYVHSERSVDTKTTRHLDGAVKVYLGNDYPDRVDSRLPKEARCFRKIKLWRIDGDIDMENWIDLISFFLKSNEMVIEYFDPRGFEEMFELRVRDFKEWQRQQAQGAKDT